MASFNGSRACKNKIKVALMSLNWLRFTGKQNGDLSVLILEGVV